MKPKRLVLLLLLFTLTIPLLAGCREPKLESRWKNRDIVIDGDDSDWGNYIEFYDENTRIDLSLLNDNSDLYIKLDSRNKMLNRQIMSLGFTVWFDPKISKDKKFGIHFPLGMRDDMMPMQDDMMSSPIPRGGEIPGMKEESELFTKRIEEMQREVEVIVPGKSERLTMSVAEAESSGISVKMSMPKGNLIYEIKIPLVSSKTCPYAIGANFERGIGIGFETGKIDKRKMDEMIAKRREQMRGRDRNMGSSGGMMPGGGGMLNPLELWTKVTLASGQTTQ
ncbi:MAG: hypothetical protein JXB48_07650 [Candidatus Latescibacteria bacterium]|nr:hypothetical protein [Candidatus Latescibacterota bacterium]